MENYTTGEGMHNFIGQEGIRADIAKAENPGKGRVRDVLAKALEAKGLAPFEAAVLLKNQDADLDQEIFHAARTIRKDIHGNWLMLFAPLHVTNECVNQCAYCECRAGNNTLDRHTLSLDELREEVAVLEDLGHKRLLLVHGEHPTLGAEWIADTVRAAYGVTSHKSGEIRRVNVNCAPLDMEGFRKLQAAGVGTYQCFQETYDPATYAQVHGGGKKADFTWRLHALHRALEAGIDDVALGVRFGLLDPVFEVLGLVHHALRLERDWGVGPHSISFPRLKPVRKPGLAYTPPHPVPDHVYKKIVAVLRMAVPHAGLVLATREEAGLRRELLELGVSRLAVEAGTFPHTIQEPGRDRPEARQSRAGGGRSLDDVINAIVTEGGCVPSWCTACSRLGRTGERFMEMAKQGSLREFCLPNGLLTFKEYLEDYASPDTRAAGEALVAREVVGIADQELKVSLMRRLERIQQGERDLCY